MNPHACLTAADVAATAQVSVRTVRRWIAAGTLPSVRIGGARRITPRQLQAALGERVTPARTPKGDLLARARRHGLA